MSKVVEFYMTATDEEVFVRTIQAAHEVAVVLHYFATPEEVELEVSSLKETVDRDGYASLCLVNRTIDPKIIVGPAGPGRYSIDAAESEVVKFSRWTIVRNDGKKEPGRLWYDDEDVNCKPKRKVFLSWANSVLRYVKRSYYRSQEHHGRYFGPDAWDKFSRGQMVVAPY